MTAAKSGREPDPFRLRPMLNRQNDRAAWIEARLHLADVVLDAYSLEQIRLCSPRDQQRLRGLERRRECLLRRLHRMRGGA
jgi:hypothetical protein